MNPNNTTVKQIHFLELLIIWSSRVFGITFGGLIITKDGKYFINKKLKIFGNIITLLIIIVFVVISGLNYNRSVPDSVYNSGFTIIYYITHFWVQLNTVYFAYTLYYYQFKGFNLCEIWLSLPMNKLENKIIILSLYIFNFMSIVIYMCITSRFTTKEDWIQFVMSLAVSFCFMLGHTVIKLMTWCKFINSFSIRYYMT